jgi:hypothetical protein
MEALRYKDYAVEPWKNGRGVTRRIARSPVNAAGFDESLIWYVGLPDIAADGPFSAFPGMDRQLLLLEGAGIALHLRSPSEGLDFSREVRKPLEPFSFRGDWDTTCKLLGGTAKVLNVIWRQKRANARVEVVAIDGTVPIEKMPSDTMIAVVARGRIRTLGDGRTISPPLAQYDSLLLPEPRYGAVAVSPASFDPAYLVVIRIGAPA